MPTLEELFKTKKIDGNLTAEQKYDIKNSKDIRVIDGFAINALRKSGIANRLAETRLEEELIGVRAIRGLQAPLLYGTDILRLKEKTTPVLDDMKLYTRAGIGVQVDGGAIGGALDKLTGGKIKSVQDLKAKAKNVVKNISNKLGINYPELKIPSRVASDIDFINSIKTPHTKADVLTAIKQKGDGNLPGKLLSSVLKSKTPNQIGQNIKGEAIRQTKNKIKGFLLGNTESLDLGSITVEKNIGIGKSNLTNRQTVYSNKEETGARDLLDGVLPKYSKSVNTNSENLFERNDLSVIYATRYNEITSLNVDEMAEKGDFLPTDYIDAKYKYYSKTGGYRKDKNIETYRGMTKGSDFLNELGSYSAPNGEPQADSNGKLYDEYDFVPLRFYSIAKETAVTFRATINGLSETLSPSFDSNKTLGNVFNYYTYSNIERSINFNFKIYSLNAKEHKQCWEKINYLTGLVYPANGIGVSGDIFITPPFLKLTLGDMFKNAEGFIDSLTYTIDDNTPWEIGFDQDENSDVENYRLPRIVSVDITYKFLDTMGDSYQLGEDGKFLPNRFYSFGGVSKKQPSKNSLKNNTNIDGSADSKKATIDSPKTNVADIKKGMDDAKKKALSTITNLKGKLRN